MFFKFVLISSQFYQPNSWSIVNDRYFATRLKLITYTKNRSLILG